MIGIGLPPIDLQPVTSSAWDWVGLAVVMAVAVVVAVRVFFAVRMRNRAMVTPAEGPLTELPKAA
jgi:hypothetical protein